MSSSNLKNVLLLNPVLPQMSNHWNFVYWVSSLPDVSCEIWTLHNTGLHSRSTPTWRSHCDEMDMTPWVHGVKACLAVSVDNNNLHSTFVPLERYQLCNVIWSDMTTAVLFLNIFCLLFFPVCHSVPLRIISGFIHKTFDSYSSVIYQLTLFPTRENCK